MFEGRLIEDEPDHVRIESEDLGGTFFIDHGCIHGVLETSHPVKPVQAVP